MYNGIGLTTPRGSGTNGYVVRNMSALRSYEPARDRADAWDAKPPQHREPDEGILEHERKRQVEVKCLELQLELEEKEELDEEDIEKQVDALRQKLLANLKSYAPSAKSLKASDTHAIAAAKKAELNKMARALGTRGDYTEGEAFDREKQEENKLKRMVEREERERRREEDRARMEEQKAKWEAERRERDRLRRRQEDRMRQEREGRQDRGMPPPPVPPGRGGPRDDRDSYRTRRPSSRSRSPPPRRGRRDSPPPRERTPPPSRSKRIAAVAAQPLHQDVTARLLTDSMTRLLPDEVVQSLGLSLLLAGHHLVDGVNHLLPDVDEVVLCPAILQCPLAQGPQAVVHEAETRRPMRHFFDRVVSPKKIQPARPRPVSSIPSSPSTKYKEPTHLPLNAQSQSDYTKATLTRASNYLLGVYARPDFVLSHGKGSRVWDTEGREFLDFSAGIAVNALGHSDEGVAKTLAEQSGKLLHASNVYHNEWAGKLAELLVNLTRVEGGLGYPAGEHTHAPAETNIPKVFFANSGTEANEGALKIARKVGKDRWAAKSGKPWDSKDCSKIRIASFEQSFHGRSIGALSVTNTPKYQLPFAPLVPGIDIGKINDFGNLTALVGEDTCAVIVEPIQGEGGINAASQEWLAALRRRCDAVGAVLIFDEIQCGLYRTGTLWAHSALPTECHPDIVTMAKPLANGYPIGAVLLRDAVAQTMTAGTHGTTFGGSPLACAVGYRVLSRLSEKPFVSQIAETSAYLIGRLERLPQWFPEILQPSVRGRGLILGLGFRDLDHPGRLVGMARERGVFILTAGKDAVRLVPSLNVTKNEVDFAIDVLESCLGEIQRTKS
ncbi:acetylornithine aminotransferase [Paramarasmius palmivorus]|uniref:Acetylornithine aminotransferase n=1 Tax=Paramarasmius palmivorus TaxID=297713 RepID=A0AAW0E7S3_9AGAR